MDGKVFWMIISDGNLGQSSGLNIHVILKDINVNTIYKGQDLR